MIGTAALTQPYMVEAGNALTLDMSATQNPNMEALTYAWNQVSGPQQIALASMTTAAITIDTTTLASGTYVFSAQANGTSGLSIPAAVAFQVFPTAGAAFTVEASLDADDRQANDPNRAFYTIADGSNGGTGGNTIDLHAVVSGGTGMSFKWTQLQGPKVASTGVNTSTLSLDPVVDGVVRTRVYEFRVKATSAGGVIARDTIAIAVSSDQNNVPTVVITNTAGDAINAQNGRVGSTVRLNALGTDGTDTTGLTYIWVQLTGAPVVLLNANSANPTFLPTATGSFTFAVFVDDGADISLVSNEVEVTILPAKPEGGSSCAVNATTNTSGSLAGLLLILAMVMIVRRRREEA